MRPLSIRHLAHGEIDKAYVLAHLGYRELTLEAWRDIAIATLDGHHSERRILMAWDRNGRPRGLALYAVGRTVDGQPSLRVERLIAFDLMDSRPVADALAAEVITIARLAQCTSFSLETPLDAPARTSALVLASPVAILHQMF